MTERRYTDAEVTAILARATESEQTALPSSSDGLTLHALQEIGREVGIQPDLIAQAARSLDVIGEPVTKRFLGLPIGVGRTVTIDRPLSDADWEALVSDLRETFEARGTLKYDGSFRQWTNGNLQALAEPTADGYRLRLSTSRGESRRLMTGGAVVIGAGIAGLLEAGLRGTAGHSSPMWFVMMVGIGIFATAALRLPGWARRRAAQIEGVTARLIGKSTEPS